MAWLAKSSLKKKIKIVDEIIVQLHGCEMYLTNAIAYSKGLPPVIPQSRLGPITLVLKKSPAGKDLEACENSVDDALYRINYVLKELYKNRSKWLKDKDISKQYNSLKYLAKKIYPLAHGTNYGHSDPGIPPNKICAYCKLLLAEVKKLLADAELSKERLLEALKLA